MCCLLYSLPWLGYLSCPRTFTPKITVAYTSSILRDGGTCLNVGLGVSVAVVFVWGGGDGWRLGGKGKELMSGCVW